MNKILTVCKTYHFFNGLGVDFVLLLTIHRIAQLTQVQVLMTYERCGIVNWTTFADAGTWTNEEGRIFLEKNSHYPADREHLFLEQVRANPGLFVSISLGKIFFNEMKRKCFEKNSSNFCGKAFNQLIVDQGPVPLPYLRDLLIGRFS